MTALIDALTAFFAAMGFLATLFAVVAGVALLLESRRVHRQRPARVVPEHPRLQLVPRDEVADRRALRSPGGWVA